MRGRALSWLAVTLGGVTMWWLTAWVAYEELLDLDAAGVVATGGRPAWSAAVSGVLLELAEATVASLWIIGTLALLVGMAWQWRRGWRLPRLGRLPVLRGGRSA